MARKHAVKRCIIGKYIINLVIRQGFSLSKQPARIRSKGKEGHIGFTVDPVGIGVHAGI